jgi:fatty-acid desaturase
MKYGSTSRNINVLNILVMISSVIGLFYFDFTGENILLLIVSFYTMNILGNWMMLHRYYAHKSFQFKSDIVRKIFTIVTILSGRGSPIGWSYIHRQHHVYSDTNNDPHSPKVLGYKLFGFSHYKAMESEKMKLFLVKDLMTKEHLFIHKYYILLLLGFVSVIGLVSPEILYFVWVLPACLVHLSQNNFNYFGHTYGYRNFATKDDSRNNMWLFPFILGEAWHNNHHKNPTSATTKIKHYEYDPVLSLIKLVGNIK